MAPLCGAMPLIFNHFIAEAKLWLWRSPLWISLSPEMWDGGSIPIKSFTA